MEEKERFELLNDGFIYDNKLKEYASSPSVSRKHYMETLTGLLNQQDQKIKELKSDNVWLHDERERLINYSNKLIKKNQQLKEESGYIIFSDGYDENGNEVHKQEFVKYKDKFRELLEENKQLKQSQKELAINELNDILKFIVTGSSNYYKPPFEIKKYIEDKINRLES